MQRAARLRLMGRVTVLVLATCGAAGGCTDGSGGITPDPTSGSAAGGSGAGKDAGADASDTDGGTPACPVGEVGPDLVLVSAPSSMAYCIDARETTRAEYDAFLAAKAADTSGQIAECAWNTSFTPKLYTADDDTEHTNACLDTWWTEALPDEAVTCVDFCDAFAYCAWAGKRLCGRVGGPSQWGNMYMGFTGPGDIEAFRQLAASVESEFGNACSQGGTTAYPYGDTYEPKCIDDAWVASNGPSAKVVTDTASSECHGAAPPFSGIHDLSGSVDEWQTMCGVWSELPLPSCATPGGNWTDTDSAELSCGGQVTVEGIPSVEPSLGFRCCADAVSGP